MKISWTAVIGIPAAALLSSMLTVGAMVLRDKPRPDAALIADLPARYKDADAAFRQRVQARFPLGSPEADLVAELRRQRFQPATFGSAEGRYQAVLRLDTWVCNQAARIWWTVDEAGHLTSLDTRYGEEGCL